MPSIEAGVAIDFQEQMQDRLRIDSALFGSLLPLNKTLYEGLGCPFSELIMGGSLSNYVSRLRLKYRPNLRNRISIDLRTVQNSSNTTEYCHD